MQGKSFQKFFFALNHFVGLKMVNLMLLILNIKFWESWQELALTFNVPF